MSEYHPPKRLRRSPRLNNDGSISISNSNTEREVDVDVEVKLVEDFEQFCQSEYLSLDLLREWIDYLDNPKAVIRQQSIFLYYLCSNTAKVSFQMIECVLDFCPMAVSAAGIFCTCDDDDDVPDIPDQPLDPKLAYPLHVCCENENCPNSVVKCLIEKGPPHILQHLCVLHSSGVKSDFERVAGTPLHYYLSRKSNVDLSIVKLFVELEPEVLNRSDPESKLAPIHALLHNETINNLHEIVQYMVEISPKSVELVTDYNSVALHYACSNKAITVETIRLLVDAWPQATRTLINFGGHPLHMFCMFYKGKDITVSMEILQMLLDANPESISHPTEEGELPIHCALSTKSSEFCRVLIDAFPESLQIGGHRRGGVLLHAASQSRLDTTRLVYSLYPEGIGVRDEKGFLPIHRTVEWPFCSEGDCPTAILEYLLEQDPDGARRPVIEPQSDSESVGRLPLHVACLNNDCLHFVKYLFNVYPDAINVRDPITGQLPLEMAIDLHETGGHIPEDFMQGRNAKTISFLRKQMMYANAANDPIAMVPAQDPDDGMMFIHRVMYQHPCLGAMKLLVQASPECVRSVTREGWLPLHHACEYTTVDIVEYLIDQDPATLNACCNKNDSPLHHACYTGNCEVVIYLLDTHSMASVSERNTDNKLPIQILRDATDLVWGLVDTPAYLGAMWRLLLAYPESILNW